MIIKRLLSLAASMLCCVGTFTTYADTIAAGISDEIQGVNGTVFTIERPDASALTVVNASDFGLSADATDNTQAMRDAFDYCRNHADTKLVVEPGIYHFSPEEDIYLNRLHDIMIDAQGA